MEWDRKTRGHLQAADRGIVRETLCQRQHLQVAVSVVDSDTAIETETEMDAVPDRAGGVAGAAVPDRVSVEVRAAQWVRDTLRVRDTEEAGLPEGTFQ